MNRRGFLNLAGLVAVAGTLGALHTATRRSGSAPAERVSGVSITTTPAGARLTIHEPGAYRISGAVRLDAARVEIGGITNTQVISWSAAGNPGHKQSSFTSFETFDRAGAVHTLHVRGGRLQSLTAVPLHDA